MNESTKRKYRILITVISIVIPVAVAILFRVKIDGVDLSFLPAIYANINALTAFILIAALMAIKNKKIGLHKNLMLFAMLLSAAFLVMYIAYHITSDSTSFGGDGILKYVYFFILITHIVLSIAVVPLVLFTLLRALTEDYVAHRKLAKITFPVWLYVAISGVIVYLMISPYYPQ